MDLPEVGATGSPPATHHWFCTRLHTCHCCRGSLRAFQVGLPAVPATYTVLRHTCAQFTAHGFWTFPPHTGSLTHGSFLDYYAPTTAWFTPLPLARPFTAHWACQFCKCARIHQHCLSSPTCGTAPPRLRFRLPAKQAHFTPVYARVLLRLVLPLPAHPLTNLRRGTVHAAPFFSWFLPVAWILWVVSWVWIVKTCCCISMPLFLVGLHTYLATSLTLLASFACWTLRAYGAAHSFFFSSLA